MAAARMERYCLLIIDIQEHFRKGMAEKIVDNLNKLISICETKEIPVIYTQHGHIDPEEEEDTSVLIDWWGPVNSIKLGSKDWELMPELKIAKGSHVITSKRTYDVFQGTELQQLLQQFQCGTLIIGGVMTNLCCETTARSAFTKNYDVMFLKDGTATATKEMQEATLLNLGYGFATIISCSEMIKFLRGENFTTG